MECDDCGKCFKDRTSYLRHSREVHGINRSIPPPKRMLCGTCGCSFADNEQFESHLLLEHSVKVTMEKRTFQTEALFSEWKREIELNIPIKFVKRNTKRSNGHYVDYYRCNRDGYYKSSVSECERKQDLKEVGSRQIKYHCPARMTVTTQSNGAVEVKYCSTHCGHNLEMAQNNLVNIKVNEEINRNDESTEEQKQAVREDLEWLLIEYSSKEQVDLIRNTLQNLKPQLSAMDQKDESHWLLTIKKEDCSEDE